MAARTKEERTAEFIAKRDAQEARTRTHLEIVQAEDAPDAIPEPEPVAEPVVERGPVVMTGPVSPVSTPEPVTRKRAKREAAP